LQARHLQRFFEGFAGDKAVRHPRVVALVVTQWAKLLLSENLRRIERNMDSSIMPGVAPGGQSRASLLPSRNFSASSAAMQRIPPRSRLPVAVILNVSATNTPEYS